MAYKRRRFVKKRTFRKRKPARRGKRAFKRYKFRKANAYKFKSINQFPTTKYTTFTDKFEYPISFVLGKKRRQLKFPGNAFMEGGQPKIPYLYELSQIYKTLTIMGSKLTVRVVNRGYSGGNANNSGGIAWGLRAVGPNDDNEAIAALNLSTAMEMSRKYTLMSAYPSGNMIKTLSAFTKTKTQLGLKSGANLTAGGPYSVTNSVNTTSGAMTVTAPSSGNVWEWIIWLMSLDDASSLNCLLYITIKYYVRLENRIPPVAKSTMSPGGASDVSAPTILEESDGEAVDICVPVKNCGEGALNIIDVTPV